MSRSRSGESSGCEGSIGLIEMKAVRGRPDQVVVQDGRVGLDQAPALQSLDPLVHRRGGQAGRLAEVGERHPAVLGEEVEDPAVEVFHAVSLATGRAAPTAFPFGHREARPDRTSHVRSSGRRGCLVLGGCGQAVRRRSSATVTATVTETVMVAPEVAELLPERTPSTTATPRRRSTSPSTPTAAGSSARTSTSPYENLGWSIRDPDGFEVLQRNALGETHYRYFQGGTYTAVLTASDGEKYAPVSGSPSPADRVSRWQAGAHGLRDPNVCCCSTPPPCTSGPSSGCPTRSPPRTAPR